MILELISIILGGMTIGSALMVILSKHPIRSVLYLVITFFFISGHFILMNAQFIAIVNIIVYAGAIMVLFLFVLMLLNLNKVDEKKNKSSYFVYRSYFWWSSSTCNLGSIKRRNHVYEYHS